MSPRERMVRAEDEHRADDGDEQAPQVEARHAHRADQTEGESTDDGSDDAEHDVEEHALALWFTILLAMKPANSPRSTQAMMDMTGLFQKTGRESSVPSVRAYQARDANKRVEASPSRMTMPRFMSGVSTSAAPSPSR